MYLNLSFNPNQTGGEAGSSPLLSSLQEATSTSTYVYLHHLALQSFLQPTQSHSGGETPKAHAPLPGAAKYRNISILIYIYGVVSLLAYTHTERCFAPTSPHLAYRRIHIVLGMHITEKCTSCGGSDGGVSPAPLGAGSTHFGKILRGLVAKVVS
jgi:hypothetical protein